MIVFDGHNDTLTRPDMDVRAFLEGREGGHLDLPRAQRGGLGGGLFAIFTPAPPDSPERDNMYGVTFTEQGYDVSERSAIDPAYAAAYSDQIIDFAISLPRSRTVESKSPPASPKSRRVSPTRCWRWCWRSKARKPSSPI